MCISSIRPIALPNNCETIISEVLFVLYSQTHTAISDLSNVIYVRPIMALSSSLTSDIYKYVMRDDQRSHSAAESQCSVHYNYLTRHLI